MRERIVVPSIRSREVARAQRSGIRHSEDALQPLDFRNGLLSVHPSPMIETLLRRLCPHAAMCALGIYELRQHAAEILLFGSHAEQNTLSTHLPVESLDIGDSETSSTFPAGFLSEAGCKARGGFARHELAPAGRFELHRQTEHIAVELHGFAMSATNLITYLSCVPCMCHLHWM